jgi:hypothetical protein
VSRISPDFDNPRSLLPAFWGGAAFLVAFILFQITDTSLVWLISGSVIALFAAIPSYLWVSGKVRGLPVFPPLALSFIWMYAVPLIKGHRATLVYGPGAIALAALTVVGFLALATLVWYRTARTPVDPPAVIRVMDEQSSIPALLLLFSLACSYFVGTLAGWIALEGVWFSTARSIGVGLSLLAIVGLSSQLGAGKLSPGRTACFFALLITYMAVTAATLYLISALGALFLAVIVYTATRRRLPVPVIVAAFAVFGLLHLGKTEMRNKHWHARRAPLLQPWDYPGYFAEWARLGLSRISDSLSSGSRKPKQATLVDRASLIQMLLLVQNKTPDPLPHLMGRTYRPIPTLLVPRILNPEKGQGHTGTSILCVYYGLQKPNETLHTTIGFGLLSEAYANFGFAGVVALAVLVGFSHGWVTRRSLGTPLLSLRSLFALLFMAVQLSSAEGSASVVVPSLFQITVTLVAGTWVFMRSVPLGPREELTEELAQEDRLCPVLPS